MCAPYRSYYGADIRNFIPLRYNNLWISSSTYSIAGIHFWDCGYIYLDLIYSIDKTNTLYTSEMAFSFILSLFLSFSFKVTFKRFLVRHFETLDGRNLSTSKVGERLFRSDQPVELVDKSLYLQMDTALSTEYRGGVDRVSCIINIYFYTGLSAYQDSTNSCSMNGMRVMRLQCALPRSCIA